MGGVCTRDVESELFAKSNMDKRPSTIAIEDLKIPISEDPSIFTIGSLSHLKHFIRKRIFEEMIYTANPYHSPCILVLDDYTTKIISSACRLHELTDRGFGIVEHIKKKRQPMRLPALYFLTPSVESINILLSDYNDPSSPQYSSVTIFFTTTVADQVFQYIRECTSLFQRLKNLYEFNLDFIAFQDRVFTLNRKDNVLRDLFSTSVPRSARHNEISRTSQQLRDLCLSLGEYPYIRHSEKTVAISLAKKFDEDLTNYLRLNPKWKFNEDRATLLILDRSMDPLSPLLHEFTTQALLNDFLNIDGEICVIDNEKVVLSETDDLWVKLRHSHISDTITELQSMLNAFKATNDLSKYQLSNSKDWKSSVAALKAKKDYDEKSVSLMKHLKLASKCIEEFKNRKLSNICDLEQDMAAGINAFGKRTDKSKIAKMLTTLIEDPDINLLDKLRLIMIYIISQDGIQEETRKHLFSKCDFNNDEETSVCNLFFLGVTTQTSGFKIPKKQSDERLALFAKYAAESGSLTVNRYIPLLSDIASSLVDDKLNSDSYPYIIAPPPKPDTSRFSSPNFASRIISMIPNKAVEEVKERGPTYIIFVAGGITFSEIRCIYEIAAERQANIIIGSTHVLTPLQYIEQLKMKN